MKYEGDNDYFVHKLSIFHHLCSKADVFHEAKSKAFSSMLRDHVLNYYLANINMLENASLDQTCAFIFIHFENPDYRKNNLTKWNQIILKFIMTRTGNEDKSTLNCFKILIKDLRDMQHDLDLNFQNEQFMQTQLIIACEKMSACRFACYKFR